MKHVAWLKQAAVTQLGIPDALHLFSQPDFASCRRGQTPAWKQSIFGSRELFNDIHVLCYLAEQRAAQRQE